MRGVLEGIRTSDFVDVYEKHQCLWNTRIPSYKDRTAREMAIKSIINRIGPSKLTEDDIKLKIKSLRTTYRRELALINKYRARGQNYVPKLVWFEKADRFLRRIINDRSNYREIIQSQQNSNSRRNVEHAYVQENDIPVSLSVINSVDSVDNIVEIETSNCDYKTDIGKIIVEEEYLESEIENGSNNEWQQVEAETAHDEEIDAFCSSIGAQLRAINDNYSRSVAKLKIQQILFEAEVGHYKE